MMSVCLGSSVFAEDGTADGRQGAAKGWLVASLLTDTGYDRAGAEPQQPVGQGIEAGGNRIEAPHALFPQAEQAPAAQVPKKSSAAVRLAALLGGSPLQLRRDKAPRVEANVPDCLLAPAPPAQLATYSKYDQADKSRSTIDPLAHKKRKSQVQPIRNSVRLLTNVAYAKSATSAVAEARAECVLKSLDSWARADALTDMQTSDAVLSRDRWVAEAVLALHEVSQKVELSNERRANYDAWLRKIADSTIEAYAMRLGPKSRTNNHRYWAGLSVIAIGVVLEDQDLVAWGRRSFEIGSCQVDANGLLPGELRRGSKALEYHLYALRPLAAIARLHQVNGSAEGLKCFDGFQRLQQTMQKAMKDPADFERYSGMRQKVKVSETSYSAALQFQQLGI
ncbi:alginate lyase family protein [Roseibium sp. Sym1]|uniref:alginate lyase family protein n=1 Tax=Roseibium sp. Sym1 TaxID=3016006 RepID=UPI0022B4FD8D|nr:alginate lyase family protein [Roseibium sp. Sym1]